ncbi:hypothetical protein H6G11_17065 [Cyanobacterium aponinum FACHB-4101]|uniref:hypothetical protein n=1 Tax=Cyanobacterium aponinum TaxID=379064 RepID=UPI0016808964|nr:hypothetical protein [Cyanobacterium aponinum]MBD2395958.1 hypothetical protein [Cyanobacterium aponinum FACHB-4101]
MNKEKRAVISQKEKKSAAPQFSEPCDNVTASEPCNVTVYSDGVYFIEVNEEIEPSYLAHDFIYFEELD